MNKKQIAAGKQLQKALDACHRANLKGGVFDGGFYVWPVDAAPDPYESGPRFFEVISENGEFVRTSMALDGGAGN